MNKRNTRTGSALIVVILIIVILAIVSLAYLLWTRSSQGPSNSNQQSSIKDDTESNTAKEDKDIVTTLPNGKVATYPDTESNQNITFRDAENGDPNSEYVFISHKGYAAFLASVGDAKIDELCGTDSNLKALKDDFIYGLLNTTTKKITPPQNWNCLDLLASEENPDVTLRSDAKEELTKISADVEAFLSSVAISE